MMSLHEKAKELAKNYIAYERELVQVFINIDKERVFEKLGFSSLFRYALSLGLSESQSYMLIGVARKCSEVPSLKVAIDTGAITSSQAKRILPVVNNSNSKEWIEKASNLKQREIEKLVVKSNPEARVKERVRAITPSLIEIKLGITPRLEEKIKRAKEIASQSKQMPCDLVKALEEVLDFYLKSKDPVEKAKRGKPLTSRKVSSNKRYVPKPIVHAVMKKFKGQCQAKEPDGTPCSSRHFIHIHHIIPRHQGGINDADNLTLLCSAHHRIHHKDLLKWT